MFTLQATGFELVTFPSQVWSPNSQCFTLSLLYDSSGVYYCLLITFYESRSGLAFSRDQDGVTAEVGDLHHHAVVHHTVGGLQAPVNTDAAGVEVRHALHGSTWMTT